MFSVLASFVPFMLAVALLFLSKTVAGVYAVMQSEWLVWAQTYRVTGLIFIPYLFYGIIPAEFAVPAIVGDFLTGLFAPFVGSAVAKGKRRAFAWAVLWNAFGILDLIVAPVTAIHSHAQVVLEYPLALVPLFLGPPLGILTHIYSLRNLARRRQARSTAESREVHTANASMQPRQYGAQCLTRE